MSKAPDASPKNAANVRILWEEAQWETLSHLQLQDIAMRDDRGMLALFIAASHFHLGDTLSTRTTLRQAVNWGATQADAASVLFGGLQNTLGRISLLLEYPDQAKSRFRSSVAPVQTGEGADKTAFIRQFHEMLDLGLLPEAANALTNHKSDASHDQPGGQAWATMLDSKIEQLNHVLTLSLGKGQLTGNAVSGPDQIKDPKTFAERHSVAQLNQDVWVLENCNFKKGGFFVEFGATNGILLSNTYLLESAFEWSGICAEPNPEFFAQLGQNRRCSVSSDCISGETGKTVRFIAADEFGGFAEHANADMHAEKRKAYAESGQILELTTISLHDFLIKHDAPKTIDYLSIDTEGSEYEILAAFPFEEWDIHFITVEHNFTSMREKIASVMQIHGYACIEAQWDDWYFKTDSAVRT